MLFVSWLYAFASFQLHFSLPPQENQLFYNHKNGDSLFETENGVSQISKFKAHTATKRGSNIYLGRHSVRPNESNLP